jgi:hypothetical protein
VTITDAKGRSTSVLVDIPAAIPTGGLVIVNPGVAKTLPVKGSAAPSRSRRRRKRRPGGRIAVTINGKVPGSGTGKPTTTKKLPGAGGR